MAGVILRPGVKGLVVVIVGPATREAGMSAVVGVIVVVDRQPPSHPCFTQDVVSISAVVVTPLPGFVVKDIVVVSRQPPNQPYLTQEVVGGSSVDVEDVVELVVVVSSRQPVFVSLISLNVPGDTYPTIPASCKSSSASGLL